MVRAQAPVEAADLTWGTPLDKKKDGAFDHMIDHGDGAYYLSLKRNEEEKVARLNGSLQLSYLRSLTAGLLKGQEIFEGIMESSDNFMVFFSKFDKPSDSNRLYVQAYSKETFAPIGERRQVTSLQLNGDKDHGLFHITDHFRDSNIICIEVKGPAISYRRPVVQTLFLDPDMNEVADRDLPERKESEEGSADGVADKALELRNGMEAFLTRQYPEDQERKRIDREKDPSYAIILQLYRTAGEQPQEIPLKIPGAFVQDLKFMEDDNGDILCLGFYGEEHSWDVRGIAFFRVDSRTGTISQKELKPFSDDFIKEGLTPTQAARMDAKAERNDEELALPLYHLNEMTRRADGSVVIVAEQVKTWQKCHVLHEPGAGAPVAYCDDFYYDGDIIAVSISSAADIQWSIKIPKHQRSKNSERAYSRYFFHADEDRIQFFFNDDIDNLTRKPGYKVDATASHGNETVVAVVTVERDGRTRYEMLYGPERKGTVIKPALSRSYTDHSVLLYLEHGNSYQFCEVRSK